MLPFSNDLGEAAFAALLLVALAFSARAEPLFRKLASRTAVCMLLLTALPIALRLALLPVHPAPQPEIYDEFSHLLVADTLRHFRLANPMHPMRQFFETFFVVLEPSYSSIYPIGNGLLMAVGRAIFGHPWAGVLIGSGAICSLSYWMLRGWLTPVWALAGGLLAVLQFGPLNSWTNNYWGGGVAAVAGCLVFGALPRLREYGRARDAIALGVGLGSHLLTRPYESILLAAGAVLFFMPFTRALAKSAGLAALAVVPFLGIVLLHNQQVTGSWMTLPALLSRYQYGVPTTFTVQPNPVPHRALTPQQEMSYRSQVSYHGDAAETPVRFARRLWYRLGAYRFFLLPPLYLGVLAFVWRLRDPRAIRIAAALVIFGIGANFYPFFFPHYVAALACVFLLMALMGLQRLGRRAALLVLCWCAADFVFLYGVAAASRAPIMGRRAPVLDRLAAVAGKQLVFVRYRPQHIFQEEWVYNEADIDGARIVWARDLGTAENDRLIRYYPDRKAWLLEADARPAELREYVPEPPTPPGPQPATPVDAPKPAPPAGKPALRFEEVPEAH